MANKRVSMQKIREIIRLNEEAGLSYRKIAQALKISRPVVSQYIADFKANGLKYTDIKDISDTELLELLEKRKKESQERYKKLSKYFEYFIQELKRTGVNRHVLWEEYRKEHPEGYSYSRFCYHFQVWKNASEVTMHIDHKAGDKAFIDFAGKKLSIIDRETGEVKDEEVFVSILGASQYTYVEAVESQKKEDWIKVNENALLYFEGVPAALVPDCLKSGVTNGNKYEPDINPEYADFARHYGTVILPARPNSAKDKALVENAVNLVYTRIYAPLRNRSFYSLEELNKAMRELLEKHNTKYIRSATIIDLVYAFILLFFKQYNSIPMSTTWVFVGLLCGRELAIATVKKSHKFKSVFPLVGRDFVKMMIGLGASVAIVLLIHNFFPPAIS